MSSNFFLPILLFVKASIGLLSYFYFSTQTSDLCRWDCSYYEDIALAGYQSISDGRLYAFYPVFPLLWKFFASFFGAPTIYWVLSALNFFLFAASLKLILNIFHFVSTKTLYLGMAMFALDRFTFWAFIPYTESLFLFLILLALYLLQRPTKALNAIPWVALAIGSISTATRSVGVTLAASWYLSHGKSIIKKMNFKSFLTWHVGGFFGVSGLILYALYLQYAHGDAFLFLKSQSHWGRHFSLWQIPQSFFHILKMGFFPTIPVALAVIMIMIRPPEFLRQSSATPIGTTDNFKFTLRLCFLFLLIIPLMAGHQSLPRFLSLLFLGHLGFAHWILNRKSTWFRNFLIAAYFASEIFWQFKLLGKYLRGDYFSWIG